MHFVCNECSARSVLAYPRRIAGVCVVEASGIVLEFVEADDDVMNFLEDMDEGRLPDIPAATTDDGGDVLTRYALEWRGRLLSDGQKFSDLGVPQGAEFRVHLLVIHHDSVVTRPLPHRREVSGDVSA